MRFRVPSPQIFDNTSVPPESVKFKIEFDNPIGELNDNNPMPMNAKTIQGILELVGLNAKILL